MSEERRQAILAAIVEGYVETSEPVGSRALAASGELGVSPATIRNDMAVLEEEGLITQPHTSAGRIPTDKGYREFVDHVAATALRDPHRRAIATFLSDAVDLNDVVERSVRLLSQLTRQVAVVQYPTLRESPVRRVELVRIGVDRALVVVVSADARVEQSTVMLGAEPREDEFERLARELNEVATGLTPAPLERELTQWASRPETPGWIPAIVDAVVGAARGGTVEKVVFSGTSHLARSRGGLPTDDVGRVLEALEEQVVLLQLLHEMTSESKDIAVRIGAETHLDALSRTSVVATTYGNEALLGSLGPTRMDYPGTMAAVRAVSRYLSKVVDTL